ncbi:hypothetical protein [Streptomyces indiaensis]|uniref:Yip1 domain-containing protein n=1 Tax=Streptomyces indiaensis TaxID=284033 RepID=A0ABN3D9F9_9ACTN|nr:hypothetical protein [Streptomyces indiaensis]MCF1646067.1 hypothetical protein [Streptomyces indiaensis]
MNSPSFSDLLDQTLPPPLPDTEDVPGTKRFARLREAWDASWEKGGFLYERWEELNQACPAGWHGMSNWIKATIALALLCSVIVLLYAASDIVTAVLHRLSAAIPATEPPGTDTTSGLWGMIDNPIRSYIGQHSAGLTVPGSTVYAFWQLTGLAGLIGGFAGSAAARIAWLLWGGSSVAMVWAASPADGRIVALLWALASVFALRGLTLRPVVHTYNSPPVMQPEFRPELHIHATIPALAGPGDDDKPDNVHQLQQR